MRKVSLVLNLALMVLLREVTRIVLSRYFAPTQVVRPITSSRSPLFVDYFPCQNFAPRLYLLEHSCKRDVRVSVRSLIYIYILYPFDIGPSEVLPPTCDLSQRLRLRTRDTIVYTKILQKPESSTLYGTRGNKARFEVRKLPIGARLRISQTS